MYIYIYIYRTFKFRSGRRYVVSGETPPHPPTDPPAPRRAPAAGQTSVRRRLPPRRRDAAPACAPTHAAPRDARCGDTAH